jgi:hypothetical protein
MQIQLSTQGFIYVGAFSNPLQWSTITSTSVVSQGYGGKTSTDGQNIVTISSIIPATSYSLFYSIQSLSGISMGDVDVRRTAMNITTTCCRTLNVKLSSTSIWSQTSIINWISLSASAGSEVSMQVQLQLICKQEGINAMNMTSSSSSFVG